MFIQKAVWFQKFQTFYGLFILQFLIQFSDMEFKFGGKIRTKQ